MARRLASRRRRRSQSMGHAGEVSPSAPLNSVESDRKRAEGEARGSPRSHCKGDCRAHVDSLPVDRQTHPFSSVWMYYSTGFGGPYVGPTCGAHFGRFGGPSYENYKDLGAHLWGPPRGPTPP